MTTSVASAFRRISMLIGIARQSASSGQDGTIGAAQIGFLTGEVHDAAAIAQQSNPFTATDEFLFAWGALKRVYQKDATKASCQTATFPGTPGTPVPARIAVVRNDGFTYVTTADAVAGGDSTVELTLEATTPGAAGNAVADPSDHVAAHRWNFGLLGRGNGGDRGGRRPGEPGRLSHPHAAGLHTAAARRRRGRLHRVGTRGAGRHPRLGEPNGAGAGTVVVYVMLDAAEAEHSGFPQGSNGGATDETRTAAATGDQLFMANVIYPHRPVTALVFVCAPVPSAIDFTFDNVGTIATGSTLDLAIKAAIDGVFLRKGDPLNGAILPSAFESAIAAIPAMPDFTLSTPSGPVQVGLGYLAVRGTVTYAS